MLFTIVICIIIIVLLFWGLYRYKRQITDLAKQLENMPQKSNQRLTLEVQSSDFIRLCDAINNRLNEQQEAAIAALEASKELQYTISCVSHDIRTPLTGADGYIQLLSGTKDEEKRKRYCGIIHARLKDLEGLLDELFLYTRLCSGTVDILCCPVQIYPPLCDSLAVFYEKFQESKREPCIKFENEALTAIADASTLRRIFRNLISNALTHGTGNLFIVQKGNTIYFENDVLDAGEIDMEHLFDRFYRGDTARRGPNAGLGLSIAQRLASQMQADLSASLTGRRLRFTLTLCPV